VGLNADLGRSSGTLYTIRQVYVFSYNTVTAYNQGFSEAGSAKTAALNLHLTNATPLVFDLEPWDTTNSTCVAAAKSFIRGWAAKMHAAPNQKAGVYGSTCASGLDNFVTINPAPDWIWGAKWDSDPSTSNLGTCVAASHWSFHQRHKQYRGPHNETWNGVTLNVDSDCANGPMYGVSNRLIDGTCL
jgi:hypothetical protein